MNESLQAKRKDYCYAVLVLMLALLQEQETLLACPGDCICYKWRPNIQCDYVNLHHLPEGVQPRYLELDITEGNISILYENEFKKACLLHLQAFSLISSQLTTLQDRVFSGMIHLTLLNLTDNSLHTLQTGVFCSLESLQELYLNKNLIKNIHKDAFCALPRLKMLSLDENKLRTLESGIFRGLNNLIALSLRGNNIEAFSNSVFENLTNITFLDLSSNNIRMFDAEYLLQGMDSLLIVYLINNNLTCDCGIREMWLWFASHNVGSIATCASPTELSGQSWTVLKHMNCSDLNTVLTAEVGPFLMYVLIAMLVLGIILATIMFMYHRRHSEIEHVLTHRESITLHTISGDTNKGMDNSET